MQALCLTLDAISTEKPVVAPLLSASRWACLGSAKTDTRSFHVRISSIRRGQGLVLSLTFDWSRKSVFVAGAKSSTFALPEETWVVPRDDGIRSIRFASELSRSEKKGFDDR